MVVTSTVRVPRPATPATPGRRRPVVVGVDGSPASVHALEWALREAAYRGAPLRVVTVWTWDHQDHPGGRDPDALRHARERQEAGLALALGRMPADRAAVVRAAGVCTELVTGDPATRLIEFSSDADLLVLASHGRHAVHAVHAPLLGGVAEVCIRHAGCPVVVVPAHDQPVLTTREPVLGTL